MTENLDKNGFPIFYHYECLSCKNKWTGKRNPATVLKGAQCPKCYSYTLICHETLKEQIEQITKKLKTKEEFENFLSVFDLLYEKNYITSKKAHKPVLDLLISKLKDSY